MVRALLAGRKTQTRRLATSPLRRIQPGDRLYVRESALYWWSNTHAEAKRDSVAAFAADGYELQKGERWTPSIHMPREFSRLTLIVEDVKVEQLQGISEADARAEGIQSLQEPDLDGMRHLGVPGLDIDRPTHRQAFEGLWSSLHAKPGERWKDNPHVVALTFRVVRGNIDQVLA